jgi:gamma-glutamyltranspeptidase / glutathione hydrolase
MLNILEGFDLRAMGHNTGAYIHHLAEAMRLAYRDRARFVADPDFVDVPVERLTSKDVRGHAARADRPRRARRHRAGGRGAAAESDETTHYSVVDATAWPSAVTYTLEAATARRSSCRAPASC